MTTVSGTPPPPDETAGGTAKADPVPAPVAPALPTATGLKPIERLSSDIRHSKIIPESEQVTVLRYSSQFARTFVRSDYYFCASKIAVARKGKLCALERDLKEMREWLTKAIVWMEQLGARPLPVPYEQIELEIKRPLAGQLVRCLTQYDRLFVRALSAMADQMLSNERCSGTLANAERRFHRIKQLCIPNNDGYNADGTRCGD